MLVSEISLGEANQRSAASGHTRKVRCEFCRVQSNRQTCFEYFNRREFRDLSQRIVNLLLWLYTAWRD